MSSARRWTILGLLCVGFMVAYFDRVNLSVAVADQDFKKYFQLSTVDRGNLNSAFFWSYAVLQIPAGWIVDRYGVKFPYAIGFLIWSLVSAGTAWASSVTQIFSLRLLLGAGESVITPAGMRWIRFNYPENQRGFAVGIYMAAAKIGPALGTPLAGWLIIHQGWKGMFLIIGLGCLLWLIPWLLLVKNDDREIEQVQRQTAPDTGLTFGEVMRSRIIVGTIIGTFCYQYFVYYCLTWLPSYFAEQRGYDLGKSSLFTGFSFTGMAIVATAAGWIADRMIDRGGDPVVVRKGFIYAGFIVASTQAFGIFASSNEVALFFSIFSLSGLGLTTANYWALTQTLLSGAAVGRVVGVQNMAANIPGIVAPILTAWLIKVTGSYNAPMVAIGFFLICGILAYYFLVRREFTPTSMTPVRAQAA
ncbi:MAG: MFS transporter [Bryobacteraceae bacterium]|nr:MFS transporter [Bryobacteraceae bacterium]